jgi:2,3-bisphosphoglycerate-independent phosphoglycerate mutase
MILDGWGHSPDPAVSAISSANTPFVDELYLQYPNAELVTHGLQVGLPDGQMGNSEVGHLNIGAGRIIYQELARINKAVDDGSLASNETLLNALRKAKASGVNIHLLGLVSDGGVHSHINHLKALCDITHDMGLDKVFVHAFTDGRDVDPRSGMSFIQDMEDHLEHRSAKIASVIGRYYSMDRDKRWERIKLAYDMLVHGKGKRTANIIEAMKESYNDEVTDEFILPIVKTDSLGNPLTCIKNGDLVIFFNFRTDRPRQLTDVLTQHNFQEYGMKKMDLDYVTMTEYDSSFKNLQVIFRNEKVNNTLGEYFSALGKSQVRIAETEKYPHVTYFFSGGKEIPFDGEDRILIQSPKVATYDLQPEMSAFEVTAAILERINQNPPDFICLNYANTDMVGHTGVFEAAVRAAETVDQCLSRLIPKALDHGYGIIVIADHGNSDTLINPDGSPNTAHTMNPVPVIYLSEKSDNVRLKDGKLADIAPTILSAMGIDIPIEMDGTSLIENKHQLATDTRG